MERFVKGDVVVVHFPFSDLSQAKRRPALVVSSLKGDDLILCQITSQNVRDDYAITFDDQDLNDGKLDKTSNIRLLKYCKCNAICNAMNEVIIQKSR